MNKKTHYQVDVLERFIPISLEKLISDLLVSGLLPVEQQSMFKQFCSSYLAVFHAQTYSQLQSLKNIYRPFNPDRDSLSTTITDINEQLKYLKSEVYAVLENANFEQLSEKELNEALNKTSPHGVKVSVDFEEFSEAALFYRGVAIQTKSHRNWKKFPFKKQAIDVQIYRRLFVLLQPKNRQQWIKHLIATKKMSLKKAEKSAETTFKILGLNGDEDVVYMKLFKDIPRADLEMLFPNTRIQMRLFDKVKLGVMGGSGTAGGVMATLSKFSVAIDPISALLTIGGFLGVLWRQIAKIFSQRAKYSAVLTKNLYFYSLDNNMGALTYLVDMAETEECKEAILSYFFLLIEGQTNRDELDKSIEAYISDQYSIPMDFEIDDGLDKLKKSLLLLCKDGVLQTLPIAEANLVLQQQWNRIIENNSDSITEV